MLVMESARRMLTCHARAGGTGGEDGVDHHRRRLLVVAFQYRRWGLLQSFIS